MAFFVSKHHRFTQFKSSLWQSQILSYPIIRQSLHHYATQSKYKELDYDLITTAEEGEQWMKQINTAIAKHNKLNPKSPHYSQQLKHVNDEIWFGVDTEFSQNQSMYYSLQLFPHLCFF